MCLVLLFYQFEIGELRGSRAKRIYKLRAESIVGLDKAKDKLERIEMPMHNREKQMNGEGQPA
jgi:hypothetical protein